MRERGAGLETGRGSSLKELASSIDRITEMLRNARLGTSSPETSSGLQRDTLREALAETPYGRAVQCIHRGLHRKQEAMRGDFDNEIKVLFANYLASKYGESAETIQRHADRRRTRAWSAFKVAGANIVGTIGTGLTATLAPKGAVWAGLGAAGWLGVGAATIPTVVAALAMAAPLGVMHLARRATRDLRESRLAGKILSETLKSDEKKTKLRAAIANGTDIFKEFDELIAGKGPEKIMRKHSSKLWTAGMLGVGGVLGAIGTGGLDKLVQTASESGSMVDFVTRVFDPVGTFRGSSWLEVGTKEWIDFTKYFWSHATAAVGLSPTPDPESYYQRFFHLSPP